MLKRVHSLPLEPPDPTSPVMNISGVTEQTVNEQHTHTHPLTNVPSARQNDTCIEVSPFHAPRPSTVNGWNSAHSHHRFQLCILHLQIRFFYPDGNCGRRSASIVSSGRDHLSLPWRMAKSNQRARPDVRSIKREVTFRRVFL